MNARRVVVIGGGLAGITAAIGLREAGANVTLVEARPRLGGAASSFARGDMMIDNGQHVFLRCCTSYQGLLARLGVTGRVTVQERFDVTVLSPRGTARLRRTSLPGPLHMGQALAGYRLLSLAERLRVARAALAMRFVDPADPALDGTSLGDWLVVSALNIGGDEASLPLSATVIKTALLGARDAADIGIADVPLGELHGRATADLLARLGAEVRLGARVAAIDRLPGGGFRVELESAAGGTRLADGNGSHRPVIDVTQLKADGVVGQAGRPGRCRGRSPVGRTRIIADRQRACRLRPAGHQPAVRGGRGVAGPVGVRQDQAGWPCGRAVPGGLAVGRRQLRGRSRRLAAGTVRARARAALARSCRSRDRRFLRHQRTSCDVPAGAGNRRHPTGYSDLGARARAGRSVDRHRLAGHDGGCRAKWRAGGGKADQ